MPMKTSLTAALLIALSAAGVSSCASKAVTHQEFPNASEVLPPPKPRLSIDALTSEAAGEAHDDAVEAWGDTMALQIARNCRFLAKLGMKVSCPAPSWTPNEDGR